MNASTPTADAVPASDDSTPAANPPNPIPAPPGSMLVTPNSEPESKTNALAVTQDSMSRVLGTVETLSPAELMEYERCECMVQAGWVGAIEAGAALAQIRDQKLYRCEYNDFKAYYRNRWQMPSSKVYNLISAAHCVEAIRQLKDVLQPQHESQLRPVFGMAPDQVKAVWQAAVAKSGGRPVTRRVVQKAANELYPPPPIDTTARVDKSALRQQIHDGLLDALGMAHGRAAYPDLAEHLERLYHHFQAFLVPVRPRALKA